MLINYDVSTIRQLLEPKLGSALAKGQIETGTEQKIRLKNQIFRHDGAQVALFFEGRSTAELREPVFPELVDLGAGPYHNMMHAVLRFLFDNQFETEPTSGPVRQSFLNLCCEPVWTNVLWFG